MFHEDRGELHGITVAVELSGGDLWIGRCDTAEGPVVVLRDADRHPASERDERDAYLEKALSFGVWPRHPQVELAREDVLSIRRLAELET